MKAIIVKNNEFQTIGFEVISNGNTLFSWGISSISKTNFQKEINVRDWMPQIFELVRLQEKIVEQRGAQNDFFHVLGLNNLIVDGKGYNMDYYKAKAEATKRKMENIIMNIL